MNRRELMSALSMMGSAALLPAAARAATDATEARTAQATKGMGPV
jgi:hypothetical protein